MWDVFGQQIMLVHGEEKTNPIEPCMEQKMC